MNITELNLNEVAVIAGGYTYYLGARLRVIKNYRLVKLAVAAVGLLYGIPRANALMGKSGQPTSWKDTDFLGTLAALVGAGFAFDLIWNR